MYFKTYFAKNFISIYSILLKVMTKGSTNIENTPVNFGITSVFVLRYIKTLTDNKKTIGKNRYIDKNFNSNSKQYLTDQYRVGVE